MHFQAHEIIEGVYRSLTALPSLDWTTAEKLLGIVAAGAFGGWVYAIVSLLDGGKQQAGWKATKGCSATVYMLGQAAVGVGGAFAALFGILTLGHTASSSTGNSDLTENPIYFAALCVVGGFVGNRLLVGVGEKMAKQLTDVKKESAKALDTALGAESKAENAEAIANQAKDMLVSTWIARDICDKLDKLLESKQPIPEDLRSEAEAARSKLEDYCGAFPTTRILFIVLGNIAFALNHADEALARLHEFIANRKNAGDVKEEIDVAAAFYNVGCIYSKLSVSDQKANGYSNQESAANLQRKAVEALKECFEISKRCGPEKLSQRLLKVKKDSDLKPLENLDLFQKLLGRYETTQKA